MATILSPSTLVMPQAPRPTSYQVRSPVYSVPEAARPLEVEPEDEEAVAKREAKAKADEEKKLGTENYKKRQFDAAIEHYSKAWELYKDITYLNNMPSSL